jgi:hypothetical protein
MNLGQELRFATMCQLRQTPQSMKYVYASNSLLQTCKSMLIVIIIAAGALLAAFSVNAEPIQEQINLIAEGKAGISTIRNHPSAPHLIIRVRYPTQWDVRQIKDSIALQQFIANNQSRLDTRCLVIAQIDHDAPADDRKQAEFAWTISPDAQVPLEAKLLEKKKVMLDGRYGWKLSYEASRPTPSVHARLRSVVYLTYAKGYSVVFMCTCAGKMEDDHLVVLEYDKQLPLFDIMATSLVIGREP